MQNFLPIAGAEEVEAQTEAHSETAEAEHSGGLSIQPKSVAFHALNLIVLLVVLHLILYKPLVKLLNERAKTIKEGVENAEKAKLSLEEATEVRGEILRKAQKESQQISESARKSAEELKTSILEDANIKAGGIIKSGHELVEADRVKTMQEIKEKTINIILKAAEKILKEKLDPSRDAKLIEESLS